MEVKYCLLPQRVAMSPANPLFFLSIRNDFEVRCYTSALLEKLVEQPFTMVAYPEVLVAQ